MANRIVRAIDEIFNDFWKRHRLNLGLAVAAVLMARRVGVGVVGRYMPVRTVPKHAIKTRARTPSRMPSSPGSPRPCRTEPERWY